MCSLKVCHTMCKAVSIWWVNTLFVYKFFWPNDHNPIWINWWGIKAIDKGEKRSRMQGLFLLKVSVCVFMHIKKYNELQYFNQRTAARICLGSGLFALRCQNNKAGCFPFLCPLSNPKLLPIKHVLGSCPFWLKTCCSYIVQKRWGEAEVKHLWWEALLISCTCLEGRLWPEGRFLCRIFILLPVSIIQKSWGV